MDPKVWRLYVFLEAGVLKLSEVVGDYIDTLIHIMSSQFTRISLDDIETVLADRSTLSHTVQSIHSHQGRVGHQPSFEEAGFIQQTSSFPATSGPPFAL